MRFWRRCRVLEHTFNAYGGTSGPSNHFGASWDDSGALDDALGIFWGHKHLGACGGHFGAHLGVLGALWQHCWDP